jgi:glycosyltransferase involved in cell wall biosynthesis
MLQLIPYLFLEHADIVSSINWSYGAPAYHTYLAGRLKHFTYVGIPLFHTAGRWCKRPIYKKMIASCDAVVVNTSHEGEFVRNLVPTTKIEVAGVGIHPEQFEDANGDEVRFRYQLGRNPVVGLVGRQDSGKGAVKLIQAMKTVWNWNREVRLVLAGHRQSQHDEVDAAIGKLSEFERNRIVRISNFSEHEKSSIYHAMDVFALPSTEESFGIGYLEAWICGKAVIGSRIGSTMCVIDEGVDGLLVNPKDAEDIARAIIELLSDNNKREKMGRNGQTKAKARFTWERVTDRVERLYLELIDKKKTVANQA